MASGESENPADDKPNARESVKPVGQTLRCDGQFATEFWDSLGIGLPSMQHLMHWFVVHASILAVLVTAGVAVLLVCCLGCSRCPSRDKDEIFRRREL